MSVFYFTFNKSQQGSNHIKADKGCEDWSGSYSDGNISICVVADGHGSDNYPRTDRGSRFAVQASMNCIREFLKDVVAEDILGRQQDDIIMQLERSILNAWYGLVEDDYANDELKPDELEKVSEKYKNRYLSKTYLEKAYGTTLIIFAITEKFCLGIQIGDGTCVILDEKGDFSIPIPADPDCQLNVTTSICDADAISEFRYYVSDTAPVAVYCGSDGIEDSYNSIDEVFALYRSISTIFAEHGTVVGEEEVSNYLPILTQRGSGDDVSIAGIINMDMLAPMKRLFEMQTNLFRAEEEIDEKKSRIRIAQERFNILKSKLLKFAGGDKNVEFTHKMTEEFTAKRDEIASLTDEIYSLIAKKQNIEENIQSLINYEGVFKSDVDSVANSTDLPGQEEQNVKHRGEKADSTEKSAEKKTSEGTQEIAVTANHSDVKEPELETNKALPVETVSESMITAEDNKESEPGIGEVLIEEESEVEEGEDSGCEENPPQ